MKGIPLPGEPAIIVPVSDLPFLAREINDAHRQMVFHGKSMLLEAKRAGDFLLEAKKKVKHGEFKGWIERNCECSYVTATKYMNVARRSENFDLETFEGGIDAFLGYGKPRETKSAPAAPFTREDASYLLKINALAEQGSTEGERSVARSKLEAFAKGFDASACDLVTQAKQMLPDWEKSDAQIQQEARHRKAEEQDAEIQALKERISKMKARSAVLIQDYKGKTKDELVELCVSLTLKNEGYFE